MGTMRRIATAIALLTLALAVAPSAHAELPREAVPGGGPLALDDGSGTAVVLSRDGVMYGRVARGRIVVTDYRRGAETEIDLLGCERRRRINALTVVCAGRGLRFQIIDGRWRAAIRGVGIDVAAVVNGSVTLAGGRGTYSIDDQEEQTWPDEPETFLLG
jgi:hypothetical protein